MIRRNHSVSRTCRLLRVARPRVNVLLKRTDDWKDRRLACNRPTHLQKDDDLQEEIHEALVRHPSFGYKRLTAVINRKRQKTNRPRVNAKRVYRVAKQRHLLLVNILVYLNTRRTTMGRLAWIRQIDVGVQMDWKLGVSMASMYR